jgi:predicted nucleotidyltransferase
LTYPTPYADLNTVLDALVERVRAALEDTLVGVYLQGSFAVGDFDEHSDVDFIVVIARELTDEEVARLQRVHEDIYHLECEWAKHLEGSYFPITTLRDRHATRQPIWYLDHGRKSLVRSDHCNTLVVRTVVREMGVPLCGPAPTTLLDAIPVEELRREIATTMHDWGQQILDEPAPYHNRFYQGYIVLSYCRMLHDLVEGRPGSKRAGAEWAKINLDPMWSDLIDRAWHCRPNPALAVRQLPDEADFQRTLRFVRYVSAESGCVPGLGAT